jgi:hypothetical protein
MTYDIGNPGPGLEQAQKNGGVKSVKYIKYAKNNFFLNIFRACCGRDPMVVGFTTTYAISAYHH